MTEKEILLLTKNKDCMRMLNEISELTEKDKDGENADKIALLSLRIHNEIISDKMLLKNQR